MTLLLWLKYPMAQIWGHFMASTCLAENSAAGWRTPRIERIDSGLFTVRATTQSTYVACVAQQSGVRASPMQVRLGNGVGPPFEMRPQPPRAPPRILYLGGAFMGGAITRNHAWLGLTNLQRCPKMLEWKDVILLALGWLTGVCRPSS